MTCLTDGLVNRVVSAKVPALPKGHPGRDEALAALRSDKEWSYPPK